MSFTGHTHSAETKRRLKEAMTGKTHTPEAREKIAAANGRRVVSDETKQKLREAKANMWRPGGSRYHERRKP